MFLVTVDHDILERRSFIMSNVGLKNSVMFSVSIRPTFGNPRKLESDVTSQNVEEFFA